VARYSLLIKPTAVEEIETVTGKAARRRIIERITQLADIPRPPGCEKVSGQDRYRVRQGNYRILYTINDQDLTVCVVKVGHRKDVYR
jgi:mRNA interferase RelE/StbE